MPKLLLKFTLAVPFRAIADRSHPQAISIYHMVVILASLHAQSLKVERSVGIADASGMRRGYLPPCKILHDTRGLMR